MARHTGFVRRSERRGALWAGRFGAGGARRGCGRAARSVTGRVQRGRMSSPRPTYYRFDRLVRRQHGIATRAQLRDVGITASRQRAELDGGRWRRLNERVICLHNGPLTRRQQLWAALLSATSPATLAGLTALEVLSLRGFATPQVHLLLPQAAKCCRCPAWRSSYTRRDGSRSPTYGSPRTCPSRFPLGRLLMRRPGARTNSRWPGFSSRVCSSVGSRPVG